MAAPPQCASCARPQRNCLAAKPSTLGPLGFVYLYVGAPERALESYEELGEAGFFAAGGSDNALLWHPSYAPVRKTERFKAFVRASRLRRLLAREGLAGILPPMGADDFVCS